MSIQVGLVLDYEQSLFDIYGNVSSDLGAYYTYVITLSLGSLLESNFFAIFTYKSGFS